MATLKFLRLGAGIAGVAVLFALAVLASTQNLTVGLVQSTLLLAIALIGVRVFRGNRARLLTSALICVGVGIALRAIVSPAVQVAADSLIALSMTVIAAYLIGPPLVRLAIRSRQVAGETVEVFARPASGAPAGNEDRPNLRTANAAKTPLDGWLPFLVAAVGILALLFLPPQRFVGAESASLQWNAHVLGSDLLRSSLHLQDASIRLGAGSGAQVNIPDSLALSALKMLFPRAWPPFFSNVVVLFGIGLFLLSSVLFLERLSFGRAASLAATILFLLLPVGLPIRFAAPLDLSIALLAVLALMSSRAAPRLYLSAAFLCGFCNTASGYEYAVLLFVLGAFKVVPKGRYGWAVALGVAGSLVASSILRWMAPAASLREAWWYAAELQRIVWAEDLRIWVVVILAFAILAAAGIYAMTRRRVVPLLWTTVTLALGAAILAVPTHLGGIPILSPADLLWIIAPQGWPTARLLELAAFALTIPVAFAASLIFERFAGRRPSLNPAVAWIGAAIVFGLSFPQSPGSALPIVAPNTAIVEFPIAEAGSRAGVIYAQELLAAKARVLQPLVFLDLPSALSVQSSPSQNETLKIMQRAGVQLVVVRPDFYAEPRWRTVEPQLYDASFFVEPALVAKPPYLWKVFTPASEPKE